MNNRKKILWLVSWYPNKYDWFDGDFVQRHARAAALYDDVHVVFVKQSPQQSKVEIEQRQEGSLTEQIIYLPKNENRLYLWQNYKQWRKCYQEQVNLLMQTKSPDLIHVHVPWKAGLIALWIKRKYRLPYFVTEHWDIYNNVVDDNIHKRSFLFRYLLKRIYTQTRALLSVSRFLAKEINQLFTSLDYAVVHNTVDTAVFFPGKEKYPVFTFLHVSNLVQKKNVEGILEAFRQFLSATNLPVQLIIVGNKDDHYVKLANELKLLNNNLFFKGEIAYPEVAKEMQRSHALVLNSNMENSPCVIGEALCCGLPVISTKVGGIAELVNHENGYLLPPQNTDALADAMTYMFNHYQQYNTEKISNDAIRKFSFSSIGSQFHKAYNNVEK